MGKSAGWRRPLTASWRVTLVSLVVAAVFGGWATMAGAARPAGGGAASPGTSPSVAASTAAGFNRPPANWRGNQCQGSPTPPPIVNGMPNVPLQQFPQAQQTALGSPNSSRVLAMAYSIFDGLTCTHYQHIYEVTSQYVYADCVGWTGNLTRLVDQAGWQSMASRTHLRRGFVPSPGRFQRFFASLATQPASGWSAVRSLSQLQGGDILAWTPETQNSDTTGTDLAGHSVLVLSAPVRVAGSANSYFVVVMDSTATPHGPQDTRSMQPDGSPTYPWGNRNAPLGWSAKAGGKNQSALSGLGIGTIELVGGTSLARTGVYWSVPRSTTARPEAVVFGAGRPLG